MEEEKLKLLKEKFNEIGKYAGCITIATSPYFLNQKVVIYLINNLFSKT